MKSWRAGRLSSETTPLATISRTYDALGRRLGRSINDPGTPNSSSLTYDSLGRVTNVTNPLGAFTYAYLNSTRLPTQVTYPNSQFTTYSYYGNTGDQRLQDITHFTPSSTVLSKFDYSYDAVGNILTWQQQTDTNTPSLYTLQNDNADQLLDATLTNTSTQATIHRYAYNYDCRRQSQNLAD